MTVAVHLVEHPLIADSLTRVRDKDTPTVHFRKLVEEYYRSLSKGKQ